MVQTRKATMNRISAVLNRLGYDYRRDNSTNKYTVYLPGGMAPMYLKLMPDGTIMRSGRAYTMDDLARELTTYRAFAVED